MENSLVVILHALFGSGAMFTFQASSQEAMMHHGEQSRGSSSCC